MSHPLASNAKLSSLNGERTDYILVGGGLQSGLMALAISHHQPNAHWIIIEQQEKLAGNHTWSFHETDLANDCAPWADPIAEYRWPRYQIRVGGRVRTVEIPYRTCSSSHFEKVVTSTAQQARGEILTHTTVADVEKNCVVLGDGRRLDASVVIDNRGPAPLNASSFAGGFQKFWGFELELNSDWPHANPIVMDDQIDQRMAFASSTLFPWSLGACWSRTHASRTQHRSIGRNALKKFERM